VLSAFATFALATLCAPASIGLLGVERSAWAQTPSEIATARQWFAEGLVREEKGEFSAALDLFRRAMQVKKTPQIIYHVGFCESRTGALVEALVDLESAASLARAAHADDVVTAAQAELADVKKRVPTIEVREAGGAKAARLIVDGNAVALSMLRTAMPLDPGEHTVAIEYATGASSSKQVTLAERDARTVDLAPAAEAPAPSAAPTPGAPAPGTLAPAAAPPSTAPTERGPAVLPWTLVGVGGALVVGGAALFVAARTKEASIHDACPSRTQCDPSLSSSYDTATLLNGLGIGLGVAGLAAAGLGVSLLVMHPSASATASLTVTPRGAVVAGTF
jgi:hypothetical protein